MPPPLRRSVPVSAIWLVRTCTAVSNGTTFVMSSPSRARAPSPRRPARSASTTRRCCGGCTLSRSGLACAPLRAAADRLRAHRRRRGTARGARAMADTVTTLERKLPGRTCGFPATVRVTTTGHPDGLRPARDPGGVPGAPSGHPRRGLDRQPDGQPDQPRRGRRDPAGHRPAGIARRPPPLPRRLRDLRRPRLSCDARGEAPLFAAHRWVAPDDSLAGTSVARGCARAGGERRSRCAPTSCSGCAKRRWLASARPFSPATSATPRRACGGSGRLPRDGNRALDPHPRRPAPYGPR